jgi:outer membrane beta-barrel protein
MESRSRIFLLICTLLLPFWQSGASAAADTGSEPLIQPQIKPQPAKPAKIDSENFEVGLYTGILSVEDFGSNSVSGARLAYHASEDLFLEAAYGRSTTEPTSYERLLGSVQLLTEEERQLSYYNLSLGFNILPGESFVSSNYAFHTDLYLIGGFGSTKFAGDDRRTLNFGFGYRAIMNDWLALHLDARDHIFDIDLLGTQKTNHNLEFSTGITLFF